MQPSNPTPHRIVHLVGWLAEAAVIRAGVCGWRADALDRAVHAAALQTLAAGMPGPVADPVVELARTGRLSPVTLTAATGVHRAELVVAIAVGIATVVEAHCAEDPDWLPDTGFGTAVIDAVSEVMLMVWSFDRHQACDCRTPRRPILRRASAGRVRCRPA